MVALDGTQFAKTGYITGGTSQGMEANARRFDDGAVQQLKQVPAEDWITVVNIALPAPDRRSGPRSKPEAWGLSGSMADIKFRLQGRAGIVPVAEQHRPSASRVHQCARPQRCKEAP